jgi:hypothetical protein
LSFWRSTAWHKSVRSLRGGSITVGGKKPINLFSIIITLDIKDLQKKKKKKFKRNTLQFFHEFHS